MPLAPGATPYGDVDVTDRHIGKSRMDRYWLGNTVHAGVRWHGTRRFNRGKGGHTANEVSCRLNLKCQDRTAQRASIWSDAHPINYWKIFFQR